MLINRFSRLVRLRWCSSIVILLICVSFGRAKGDFVITNFSTQTNINYLGDARAEGSLLRVTDSAMSQSGAAWLTAKQSLAAGFTTDFQIRIISTPSQSADGMAFIIQNNNANQLGTGGGNLGFDTILNPVALEFDTHGNPNLADPGPDHFAIMTGNDHTTRQVGVGGQGVSLESSTHLIRIVYKPGLMKVFLDDMSRPALYVPIDLQTINNGNTLDSNGAAYLGFTAGTGGGGQTHDVLSWSFRNEPAERPHLIASTGFTEPPIGVVQFMPTGSQKELGFSTSQSPTGTPNPVVGTITSSSTPTYPIFSHSGVNASTVFTPVDLTDYVGVELVVHAQARGTTYESEDFLTIFVTNEDESETIRLLNAGVAGTTNLNSLQGRGYFPYVAEIPDHWQSATLYILSSSNSSTNAERYDFDEIYYYGYQIPAPVSTVPAVIFTLAVHCRTRRLKGLQELPIDNSQLFGEEGVAALDGMIHKIDMNLHLIAKSNPATVMAIL